MFDLKRVYAQQVDSYFKSNEGEIAQIEECVAEKYDVMDIGHKNAVLDWEATEKACSIQYEATTATISARRTAAIESAQRATKRAIADSKTHFEKVGCTNVNERLLIADLDGEGSLYVAPKIATLRYTYTHTIFLTKIWIVFDI